MGLFELAHEIIVGLGGCPREDLGAALGPNAASFAARDRCVLGGERRATASLRRRRLVGVAPASLVTARKHSVRAAPLSGLSAVLKAPTRSGSPLALPMHSR